MSLENNHLELQREIGQEKNNPLYRFAILVFMVYIAGFSQGMLLPVIAIMLENIGVPASLNGLNAAALYIGILIAAPFIEKPVRKYGYKPVIVAGLLLIIVSISLFPFWHAFWFWFMLRIIVGIGDNMLHFATQVWITSTSAKEVRGRNIAIYGLAFGAGFGMGPLTIRLLEINEALPFIIASVTSIVAWISLLWLRNEWPDNNLDTAAQTGTWSKYGQVIKLSWFALLPAFGFGFLEATIHGSFPVYALRHQISVESLSLILPAFVLGSLITQLPLGALSDRYGRRKLLLTIMIGGLLAFGIGPFVEETPLMIIGSFFLAGCFIGSLFSLGIAYMADLLPKSLLPTGNVMAGVCFALGSMSGPLIGGVLLEWLGQGSFYIAICGMLLLLIISGLLFKERQAPDEYVKL